MECDNKDCILASKFCNGAADCTDGSDEKAQCCAIGKSEPGPGGGAANFLLMILNAPD